MFQASVVQDFATHRSPDKTSQEEWAPVLGALADVSSNQSPQKPRMLKMSQETWWFLKIGALQDLVSPVKKTNFR